MALFTLYSLIIIPLITLYSLLTIRRYRIFVTGR